MSRTDMAETGSATANHRAQSSGGSMACSAIRFWGEDIGELCPPTFAARAMPNYTPPGGSLISSTTATAGGGLTIRQGANADLGGSVRRIGYESSSYN